MYTEEYRRKLVSPEEAAEAVPEGGALIHGLTMAEPPRSWAPSRRGWPPAG